MSLSLFFKGKVVEKVSVCRCLTYCLSSLHLLVGHQLILKNMELKLYHKVVGLYN